MIVKFTGFEGEIVWDATKPDGQPGRMLDVSRAEKKFGFRAKVGFEEGVEEFGHGMPGWEDGRRGHRDYSFPHNNR